MKPDERLFEESIEQHLLDQGGYGRSLPEDFDAMLGLNTTELFSFVEATQAKEWKKLLGLYGSNDLDARTGFAKRLAKELDSQGTVYVLRRGVIDRGVTIQLAFFKPAHSLTPELVAKYDANRLSITRQFPYDPASSKTIDIGLLVNGIPVATAELKNPLTGQDIEHAIRQYRKDRDPSNLTLSKRAIVHFAVDPDRVAMTTRLLGEGTRFLPFNLGYQNGKGNPPNPNGHRTSYLWEKVWTKDAWMDLLSRFVHVEKPKEGSTKSKKAASQLIFPRYHQWDAVLKLEVDAKASGVGKNYLIEHSAGSGKSNTIAWLSHRLSSLHDSNEQKIFDKIIVITDRRILDKQLRDTIYELEHARGVVVKIDKDSKQLAEALSGEQAKIIVTTLQKFPFVLDKVKDLPRRQYAVVIDEAHSSQTGEDAKDLRMALGATAEQELTAAEAEDMGLIASAEDPVEEALAKAVSARGHQPNISFFAFTATPKARTLEMFGTYDKEMNRYLPFHLYSMRQAIEEGFIMDVLANYTTYETYWKIEKTILDDPQYESRKAQRAIARFVSLHPTNLAQKAEIIVEHFRSHTQSKIGGKAKAMVVTSSRLHAIRYKEAIDTYIKEKGYSDLAALVAFSGKVIDEKGFSYTESQMNGFPESQTADKFDEDDYQVLIVAEKFQTGFDQPLLHTMYVDRILMNLAAVQTLSRLNRIHPLKDSTFVLDFRNKTEDILEGFEPYYTMTAAPPTDPNLLYDTRRKLDDFDVLRAEEIEAAVAALLTLSDAKGHGAIYSLLDPAVERFQELSEDDQLLFKDALNRFVRIYSFLSQVVSFGDTKLERDSIYCRALASRLRNEATSERLDLGSQVELTHLRHEMTYEGSLKLSGENGEVVSIPGEGMGKQNEPPLEALSKIVDELNKRFGLNLTEADQLFFDQIEAEWLNNDEVLHQVRNNSFKDFRLVFDPRFLNTVIGRMDANESIFKKILDDKDFQELLLDLFAERVYGKLKLPENE